MRRIVLGVCVLFLSGTAAMAQGKVATMWNCSKPSVEHKIDAADAANHTYWIGQISCNATKGMVEGVKEKSGAAAEFREVSSNTMRWHGQFTATMENGDKVFYSYSGSGSITPGAALTNKWTITGGTGKMKGMKGSGSCSGKAGADGSGSWDCTGTYTAGK